MISFNQGHTPGNTQVYSPFGTIVVEQRDPGFQYPRVSAVPEPMLPEPRPLQPKPLEPKPLEPGPTPFNPGQVVSEQAAA